MNCLTELIAKQIKVKFNLGFLMKKKPKIEKINLNDVYTSLKEMGIENGDTIMVHSSLSYLNASAEEVIEMLKKLVGRDGNILMPTHPKLEKTEQGIDSYNSKTSKSTVGYLTEYFRNMPDVKRSLHPFSSVAVWGKDSDFFLEGNCDGDAPLPHGINSSYYKFAQKNGKTVCIGVTAKNRGTIKHVPEEIIDENLPLDIFEEIEVYLEDSKTIKKFRRTILAFSMVYMCKSKIEKDWMKWNILKKQKIGSTPIEVLDASKCVELMKKNILEGSTHYPYAPKRFYRENS